MLFYSEKEDWGSKTNSIEFSAFVSTVTFS